MLRHDRSSRTYELLFHHFVVQHSLSSNLVSLDIGGVLQCILCFGSTVAVDKLYAFGAVALLMELNSIFLHLRLLTALFGLPKDSDFYRLISLGNIGECTPQSCS